MKYVILFAAIILSVSACKEKCDEAGTGGGTTIVAFPKHHDKPIYSQADYPDSAFVKFSPASNFIVTSNPADYDLVIAGEAGADHVHIPNLKCGEYSIYMTGMDTSISQRVVGGIRYTLPENAPSEIDLDGAVAE